MNQLEQLIRPLDRAPRTKAHVLGPGSKFKNPTEEIEDFDLDTAMVKLVGEDIAAEEVHFDDLYLDELNKNGKNIFETTRHGIFKDLGLVKRTLWSYYMVKPMDLDRIKYVLFSIAMQPLI
jgi:hypothetical protein